jgi:hypothetical protein
LPTTSITPPAPRPPAVRRRTAAVSVGFAGEINDLVRTGRDSETEPLRVASHDEHAGARGFESENQESRHVASADHRDRFAWLNAHLIDAHARRHANRLAQRRRRKAGMSPATDEHYAA